ncbi:MepB family protein [uncultured Aquimarina sp.]|uniref:MepB family protein n=1 Tax=uncultured Aquimarina sp. TaxID=575652 RepID=UPI002616704B|nr:MepB family protein [uncultured Aquimarina sp.]
MLALQNMVYEHCDLEISDLIVESEGKEYDACNFLLNEKRVISRSAKITPKKVGQFVTFWKRNKEGITAPYEASDHFDFFIVQVTNKHRLGQFVFPKKELVNRAIVTTESKDGKRGFRVYPIWDQPQSKQAIKTQQWQLHYFYEITNKTDVQKVIELYHLQ